MTQPPLIRLDAYGQAEPVRAYLRELTLRATPIDRDFLAFHRRQPGVFEAIVELCFDWRRRGRARWSIDGVFQVLRWQRHFADLPDPDEEFKLNDHYRSRYARAINLVPGLEDFFEVRTLRERAG